MAQLVDNRDARLEERELALSIARESLRTEREQLNSDRAEADRLLAEAKAVRGEAVHLRDRAKRLAGRFVRKVRHEHAVASRQLEEQQVSLVAERTRLDRDTAHVQKVRSQFHADATAARDRLRDAWAAVRTQQKRAAREWIEAQRFISEEYFKLSARTDEIVRQEKTLAENRARTEAEISGLSAEAAALETRVEHARTSLTELEGRRDRARAELLGTELPADLVEAAGNELVQREQALAREKAAVAALRKSLEEESADLNDCRRLVAEQLKMLAAAQTKWQLAERQTLADLEQLAHDLGRRESELAPREQHLIRADARRREDAYDLWQLRMRLEAWQTKLTSFEMRWHTEREHLETDFERRLSLVTRRETDLEDAFETLEKARANERERMRTELELWSDDRKRMEDAIADYERDRKQFLDDLAKHAARALAAEQTALSTGPEADSKRALRRLLVLQKRWVWEFERRCREIDHQRAEASAERASLEERYSALQDLLREVVDREFSINQREAKATLKTSSIHRQLASSGVSSPTKLPAPSAELTALRGEVERLATLLVELELPEPPDPSVTESLWGGEDGPGTVVIPMPNEAWAA